MRFHGVEEANLYLWDGKRRDFLSDPGHCSVFRQLNQLKDRQIEQTIPAYRYDATVRFPRLENESYSRDF